MTTGPAMPEAAVQYIAANLAESRAVLAFRISRLYGYPCTKEGVKGVIRRLRKQAAI